MGKKRDASALSEDQTLKNNSPNFSAKKQKKSIDSVNISNVHVVDSNPSLNVDQGLNYFLSAYESQKQDKSF